MNSLARLATITGATFAALAFSCTAHSNAITSHMYNEAGQVFDSMLQSATTEYLYFRAQDTVHLTAIEAFGEPLTHTQDSSDFRWQIFHTTSTWDTQNGNGDRLYYEQFFLPDNGRTTYSRNLNVFLEAGEYYRLSFQVSNMTWAQPFYTNDSLAPFTSSSGLFTIFGYGNPPVGPLPSRSYAFSLVTQSVPEPGTLLLIVPALLLFTLRRTGSQPNASSDRKRLRPAA